MNQVEMRESWKLLKKEQILHIWLTSPNRIRGITPLNSVILNPVYSSFNMNWYTGNLLSSYMYNILRLICSNCPRNGGMFRLVPKGKRSWIVKPLSAMTESPSLNSCARKPLQMTISLSEMLPVYTCNWFIKVTAPLGAIPINPLSVVWFL